MAALLALLAAVGWGSSDYAAGSASRKSSAVSVVILTHFAAVVALAVVALDFSDVVGMLSDLRSTVAGRAPSGGIDWAAPAIHGGIGSADIGWGLAAGVGGGLGAMLLFRGLGRGSMAVVAPITAAGAAAIPATVGIVGGDPADRLTLLGIAVALAAIMLISIAGGDEPAASASDLGAAGRHAHLDPHDDPTTELPVIRLVDSFDVTERPSGQLVGVGAEAAAGTAMIWEPTTRPYRHPESPTVARCDVGRSDTVWATLEKLGSGPDRASGRRFLARPGLPEALLSGIGFGAFFVFISRASETAGFWPLVTARSVSVMMFVLAAVITSTAMLPERGSRRAVVLAGLLDAAAAMFFVLSTRAGLLSVGAVLASLYPGATVLLARFVGGERIRRQQLVGLGLAIGAVSLLAV